MSKSDEVSQTSSSAGTSKYVDGINEERFDLFLQDLRSGKYEQGKASLHTITNYNDGTKSEKLCCLGVACLRPAAEGVIDVKYPSDGYEVVRYDGYNSVDLPDKVADYLGIPEVNRVDSSEGSCNIAFLRMGWNTWSRGNLTAIGFNDTLGKNFAEIADAFEKEFLK